jgi:hypothetical protein
LKTNTDVNSPLDFDFAKQRGLCFFVAYHGVDYSRGEIREIQTGYPLVTIHGGMYSGLGTECVDGITNPKLSFRGFTRTDRFGSHGITCRESLFERPAPRELNIPMVVSYKGLSPERARRADHLINSITVRRYRPGEPPSIVKCSQ